MKLHVFRRALITLIAVGTVVVAAYMPTAAATEGPLAVRGGVIFFNRPEFDSVVLVEFPFALNRSDYAFFRPDTTAGPYFARIFAQVNLYGVDGLPVDSANTYFSAMVTDSAQGSLPGYSLFNSLVLVVRPGTYSARLLVIDAVSKNEGERFLDRIDVEPPVKDRLSLGGTCLAYHIAYVGQTLSVGEGVPKNGYEVRVNPAGVFSTRDSTVYVYAELYNLKYDSAASSEFEVGLSVLNDSGKVYRQLSPKTLKKPGRSAVVVESFGIPGWPTGSYVLQMTVADKGAGQEVTRELPFSIVSPRPNIPAVSQSAETDPGSSLDLQTQLNLVHYLLTPEENKTLAGLTDEGKRAFIERYWKEKDPDPTTPKLENRLAMYERYLYANNFYSVNEGKTDGWYTDRGRVLMTYGPADKIEDYPHPASGYPYEIWWYYSLKDGKVFVFQDTEGYGYFKLVHSTMEGEIFSGQWDEALRSGMFEIE